MTSIADASLTLHGDGGLVLAARWRVDDPHGADPARLAVLAAAAGWHRAAFAIPVRLRDLLIDDIVDRHVLVTTAERRPDGRVDLRADGRSVEDEGPGARPRTWGVDPDTSPVAGLLHDALTGAHDTPPLSQVVAVLAGWGCAIEPSRPLAEVDRSTLTRDRHRVARLAMELSRRHRPRKAGRSPGRPGIPVNLPEGFVPACPL